MLKSNLREGRVLNLIHGYEQQPPSLKHGIDPVRSKPRGKLTCPVEPDK